jgi:UDP-N-acetylmuramate: L-alanyl-gamma-D-glutamyl-meso-diaminopimelate ligase
LARGCWSEQERFGGPQGRWQAGSVSPDGAFEVALDGQSLGTVRWQLLGEHNRQNALAAIAAARHIGIDPDHSTQILGDFAGVRRRMELKGVRRGVAVYDDFAHHPSAIRVTLEGLRRKVGAARILAVLEPRSNTMKLGVMKDSLPASLAAADKVFVHAAGLGWDPAPVFSSLGMRAACHDRLDGLVAAVAAEAREGDHVLAMSNGGFGGFHGKLLEALEPR